MSGSVKPVGVASGSSTLIGTSKGEIIHKPLQPFFKAVNGSPLTVTKAVWGITPIIQAIGLVNESAGKLARAFYGVCWSIVYTCYRPWKDNRYSLPDQSGNKKTPEGYKTLFNINEHFRFGMGSLVSAVYGGGALGMLWSWFKGDDDLFDKSADVYQIGMFNQNQIFDSMNYAEVLKRRFIDDKKLTSIDKDRTKANIELVDSVLFIPNIITRGMDTLRLFGKEFGDGTQKIINSLSYFGYGTWAARYGYIKQFEDTEKVKEKKVGRGEGLLDNPNPQLKGKSLKTDEALRVAQKYGGKLFHTLLPGLSWLAAGTELLGFKEFAQKAFKLEGILERLNPAISSWCIRNTWLNLFKKKPAKETVQEINQPVKKEETTQTPTTPKDELYKLLITETEGDVVNWDAVFKFTIQNNLWDELISAIEKGLVPLLVLHEYSKKFPSEDIWDKALDTYAVFPGGGSSFN